MRRNSAASKEDNDEIDSRATACTNGPGKVLRGGVDAFATITIERTP